MPRRSGKKKKGRVIKPGFEDAMKQKFTEQINEKLKSAGLGAAAMQTLNLPTAAQSAAESDSALDASVYTYYSEQVNEGEEASAANDA